MKSIRFLNGYKLIYMPEHPSAMTSSNWVGYIYEHRLLMEEELGRALLPDEHVHHLNGVKSDNRRSNLIVLSRAHHSRLHAWISEGAVSHERTEQNGENSGEPSSKEQPMCIVCGLTLQGTQKKFCSTYHYMIASRKVERPSIETLLKEVSEMGLSGTGRKYGVSGNAVKKWVKNIEFEKAILSRASSTLEEGAQTSGEV